MLDVVTIGTATRDVFLESPFFRVVRDPAHLEKLGFPTGEAQCFALGGKLDVNGFTAAAGGGAANTAVTFARQGFRTATIVKVGQDADGRAVQAHLKQAGIRLANLGDPFKQTAYSVILLSPGGERTILNYRGASEDLTLRDVPLSKLKCRWAYIVPGRIAWPVMHRVITGLKRRGTKIAMNPSRRYLELGTKKLRPLLNLLDVVILNREEAALLTGCRYEDEHAIFRRFDDWVPGLAVMTEGSRGVLVSDGRYIYRAGVFREKRVADRTGAGDAFGSGFVSGLIRREGQGSRLRQATDGQARVKGQGYSPEVIQYAIRLGAANATSVVEKVGAETGILTRKEFETARRWRDLRVRQVVLRP
ncbi:MAG: carbohydrate kinase family protein [Candidatus Liptonbacteria bacterium]|nr:carbohydrate kinase family protein [Candidatus Liptonbacteria bacterium]